MSLAAQQSLESHYVMHTFGRSPVEFVEGHGMKLTGDDGREYLDFLAGIGVCSLGHGDPAVLSALEAQTKKLMHVSNYFYIEQRGQVAALLSKLANDDVDGARVLADAIATGDETTAAALGAPAADEQVWETFFANSGAEANEGAIKAARKYSVDHYRKDRTTVITLVNSFHGRTIATLTATGQEVFHNYFGPFNEGFLYAPAGDIEALEELVDRTTCAVMLELIQGEGGVMALDPDYVQAVRKLCDEKDLVLIVDEVQTGVGRTGTFLCCEHYNLKPDIVTLAKGLGGGLPIGAVLMNEKVAEGMGPGTHGSTFGGNPVVCAGANVVVDRLDQSFLAQVSERAVQLRAGLAKLPHVKNISGIGLMVGIEFFDVQAADVLAACREKGLLVLTAKTRLRLLPPLTVSEHEVDMALEVLAEVLGTMEPTAPKEQA